MKETSLKLYNITNRFFNPKKSKYFCHKNDFSILIPVIKKICGFYVKTTLNIKKQYNDNKKNEEFVFMFYISSKKVKINKMEYYKFFWLSKKYTELNLNNINNFLHQIKIILNTIKYNRLIGIFESDELKNIENILYLNRINKKNINPCECCICYEKTICTTKCNHYLCLECWSKLKKNDCPYCRSKFIKIKKI